jgi:NADH-quinone oxidoreductase subunit N
MTPETAILLLPEIVLIAAAVVIYMGGAFAERWTRWNAVALVGVLAAAAVLAVVERGQSSAGNAIFHDQFALFTRSLALALALVYVMLSFKPLSQPRGSSPRLPGTPEMFGSLLLTVAGVMLTAAAADLVLVFVSLELVSIPTYILLYLGRRDALQQESAAKYFYLSVLSSAVLLYGFSFLYGVAGTTDLRQIRDVLVQQQFPEQFNIFAKLAAVFIFAALSFRLTAVPFHFYAPDVYQGNTHANSALLSVIPKLAGLAAFTRIIWWAIPDAGHVALWLAIVLAFASMTLGNVLALWQDNLRRLMAYSSIAHAGYLLVGFAAALAAKNASGNGWDGLGAMMFYLCVYAAATIGAFAVFQYLGRQDDPLEGIDELAGLGREKPIPAAMLAVFMFSLTGIPIVAGFWGKFQIFGSALFVDSDSTGGFRPWFIALAIVGVLNAAVSAGYYLRVVAVMYFRSPLGKPRAEGGSGAFLAAVLCCLLTIGLGLYPRPLLRESNRARPDLQPPAPVASENAPSRL